MTAPTPRKIERYGWVPDLPDARDHLYAAPPADPRRRCPASVDLRDQCPPVYDQGSSAAARRTRSPRAFEFDLLKQSSTDFMPSRLFIYYNERVIEGTVGTDSGAMIRDGIKSVAQAGRLPGDRAGPTTSRSSPSKPSGRGLHRRAGATRSRVYQRVPRVLNQLQGLPGRTAIPFVFGFTVYESFESQEVAQTGVAPMPQRRRAGARRARRARRRLRRRAAAVPRPQLLGRRRGGWAATSRCPTPT